MVDPKDTDLPSIARIEPDVYETSDLPEDDQVEFDAELEDSTFLWSLKFPGFLRNFLIFLRLEASNYLQLLNCLLLISLPPQIPRIISVFLTDTQVIYPPNSCSNLDSFSFFKLKPKFTFFIH
uniref:Uncharacterized protein n=1 Tax=Neovison vison TaxID=452646 RepID=A0A8C7A9J4_NEOVI